MSTTYAIYKLTAEGWGLWWVGGSAEAARAEFRLCFQYGGGAKLRVFASFAAYTKGLG